LRFDEGGSLSWVDKADGHHTKFTESVIALVLITASVVVIVGFVLLFHSFQSRGEAPPYTCAPGGVYTVQECAEEYYGGNQ
jgi:hypothetical protein